MCVIVDNDVAPRVLLHEDDADFGLVHKCILEGKPYDLKLYIGGHLTKELVGNHDIRRMIAVLDKIGRVIVVNDEEVIRETERVEDEGLCTANDSHVIALARVSGARVICTNDNRLQTDIKNKAILDTPRGKVYKKATHRDLLRKACECN